MTKRFLAYLSIAALLSGVLTTAPAQAQDPAPEIPAEPNIVDPPNDANFINEGTAPGLGHNHEGPRGASTVADLLAVWFTHDDESIYVHFQTVAPPPATVGITYQAFASPGEGEAGSSEQGCLRFLGNIPGSGPGGGTYFDDPWIRLLDRCNVGTSPFNDAIDGEHTIADGPDDTGITTFKFPRSYSPLLADDSELGDPTARGSSPTMGEHQVVGFAAPSTDDTEVGTPYTLGGDTAERPKKKKTPPGKSNPPGKGKKKGCPKGKGKKKGACPDRKKKKPAKCPAYVPGEQGAEAETITLTEKATEEKPVEHTVELDGSVADVAGDPSEAFFNVQVDTKNEAGGLHGLFEFPTRRDYDLLALWPDGSEAASAHLFNTLIEADDPERNHAGESTESSEHIIGLTTPDCGGWTMAAQNWLGEGGEFTITLWLGPPENEPAPPGGDEEGVARFWSLLGV